jgi:hypothetical protein
MAADIAWVVDWRLSAELRVRGLVVRRGWVDERERGEEWWWWWWCVRVQSALMESTAVVDAWFDDAVARA